MRYSTVVALAGLAVAFVAPAARGQTVIIHGELPEGIVIGPDGVPRVGDAGGEAAAGASRAGGAAANQAPPSERQKRLEQIEFDRRPSAILKAWSEPPKPSSSVATESTPSTAGLDAADSGASSDAAPSSPTAGDIVETPGNAPGADAPAGGEEDEGGTTETPAEVDDAAKRQAEKAAGKKAEEEARKAEEAARKEAEAKALEAELEVFRRDVTLGRWEGVKGYLGGLTEDEGKAGYKRLLESLKVGPPKPKSPFVTFAESNVFAPGDVIGLAAAVPAKLEPEHLASLAEILKQCLATGNLLESTVTLFKTGAGADGFPLTRRQIARMLFDAGEAIAAGEFLPTAEVAIEEDDRDALNLLSRYFIAMHEKEKGTEFLEQAWTVTQAVLAQGEVSKEEKDEALTRAVDLAPKIGDKLGQSWLDESFTERPERGMEIVSAIGTAASQGLLAQAKDDEARLRGLSLQTTAANALIAAAPQRAEEWREPLALLAHNWLKEASYSYQFDTSTSRGPSLERDVYGNFFYWNQQRQNRNNQPDPIATPRMLDIRPSDAWLDAIHDELRPKFTMVIAQLFLKIGEAEDAFPYIESLARLHPRPAKELVDEFLRVWARDHDPNVSRRSNPYVYIYGFEQRANGIPLTRSKQERNLKELAEWIGRLRDLPIEDVDEELLAQAFTAAHSTAEVYRLETIERVFGSLEQLKPRTLAELIQRMRGNLVSVWRDPAVQKDQKTQRRQKDIQNEVLRGYQVARAVVAKGLAQHGDHWALRLADAAIRHDENNYHQEVSKSSEFTSRRREALAAFGDAARRYAADLPDRKKDEWTSRVFETWFYAALGACDLEAVDSAMVLAQAEIAKIREAILALPGDAAEAHVGLFANTLFTRMGNANPAVKFRYVRAGLEIVTDHERATQAREVFDYYKDLVTEIRLEARIDGDGRVGHEDPFGVFVDLRHTTEIERESGGFQKYLVNQNNQSFSWNYGRPTENYRDKFEEAAREALNETFDVISVTFNHPKAHSKATEEYGWRVTPYAYLLLKARGPEVDRVPALRLDLDFLDTSGYAVIPVESPAVVIDAARTGPAPRPFEELRVTQTLDERQAKEGMLALEVKATARGLVPELHEVIELAPEGFRVDAVEDPGVSVIEFDAESEGTTITSERIFLVKMSAEDSLEARPQSFTFGRAKTEAAEMAFQRFVDADLESVEATIALEHAYGEVESDHRLVIGTAAFVLIGLGFLVVRRLSRPRATVAARFEVPHDVTPFTVLGLLRDIEGNDGLSTSLKEELGSQIRRIESYYFQGERPPEGGAAPDLADVASTWVRRSRS